MPYSIVAYGKMFFIDSNGIEILIQPNWTRVANDSESKRVLELLLTDEYIVVPVAMPKSTFKMIGNNKCKE